MMGGLGLFACLAGLAVTLLVLGGVAGLVIWARQSSGERGRPPTSASLISTGAPGTVKPPAQLWGASECPNCGRPIQAGRVQCAHCGAPLGKG
jgi:hypothetical protein